MSDKGRIAAKLNSANIAEEFDKVTQERTFLPTAIWYDDEFMAAGKQTFPTAPTNGVDWVKKIQKTTGAPDVTGVASAAWGNIQAALDATSEKQEATLYWADNKHIDVTKGVVYEARVKLSVLPSAAGVQAFWGLANTWIDGPDNNTFYVEFGATANGTILMRSQDGVTQNGIATTKTVLTTDFPIFRIDLTNVNDVGFYIDGVQMNTPGQIKFAATGANAILQPMFGVYKPAGVGVATLVADYVKIFSNRS